MATPWVAALGALEKAIDKDEMRKWLKARGLEVPADVGDWGGAGSSGPGLGTGTYSVFGVRCSSNSCSTSVRGPVHKSDSDTEPETEPRVPRDPHPIYPRRTP